MQTKSIYNNTKFTNIKYKKTYKNTKDSTFFIRQTLIMKLHNKFNI